MSAVGNKAIVRRWFEADYTGAEYEEALDEIVAPGYVCHIPRERRNGTSPRPYADGKVV